MRNSKSAPTQKSAKQRQQKFVKIAVAVMTLVMMISSLAIPAFATSINTSAAPTNVVSGIIDFICTVAMYIGFVVTASGIFMFIMAYKDDNAESQSRGARMAVVGALLIGLKPLLKLVKIIR